MLIAAPVRPLLFAPEVLAGALFVSIALVGVAVAVVARWGARTARTTRKIAEATGQLVVLRAVAGGPCTPICVPKRFESLFASTPTVGETLPPWRADLAVAIEALCERVLASPSQSSTLDCDAADFRLRLVGARAGDGEQLLLSLAEAGPDVMRVNRLETAALLSNGVAHDLMNVLQHVNFHAELGQDVAVVPAAHDRFQRVLDGSKRAEELVSLMRRYLRGQAIVGAKQVPTSVAAIVEEVVRLTRPMMPRGVDVALDLDESCVVLAEPVHLHQIVLNLVVNASHALRGHAAPRLAVTVARDGASVEMRVADNGAGLPPALRASLFEPYVTTRTASGGTGLGLAVVRTLVADALGGEVRAQDTAGGGATFVVRLPAVRAEPRARPPRPRTGEHATIA